MYRNIECARRMVPSDVLYEDGQNNWGRHGKGGQANRDGRRRKVPKCRVGIISTLLGIRGSNIKPGDVEFEWDPKPDE